MKQKGSATLANLDSEISALRQRMNLPPPRQQNLMTDAPPLKKAASGASPLSMLYAGAFDAALLSSTAARSFPTTSAAQEDGAAAIQKHDVLRYVARQRRGFDEAMSVINDFKYDEELERQRAGSAAPAHHDPFLFVEVDDRVPSPQHTPQKPLSPPPPQASKPTSSRATSVAARSGVASTARHGLRTDLYSVDAALGHAEKIKPPTLRQQEGTTKLTAATLVENQARFTAGGASAPPSVQAAPPALRRLRQVKYREPSVMRVVDRGLIRFCGACSHVVLGEGSGECPHCGASIFADGPAANADAQVADESVGDGGPLLQQRGAIAHSLAELEAEEARKFREAVAEWRATPSPAPEAGREANTRPPVPQAPPPAKHLMWERKTLYFTHLWEQLRRMNEQASQ